jgi:hypothetical protein
MGDKITRKDGRLKLTEEEKEAIKEPATYMVKYISILYNNLSRFFNKDMKTLLELPLFRKALENPETPLRDLADVNRMKKAILHALVPSSEVDAILKRMYRSMELPSLDYLEIADELINLTANDFKDLMNVEKVPLVATVEKSHSSSPAQAPDSSMVPATEAATSTNPKALSGSGKTGEEKKDDYILTEEEKELITEIGELNPAQLKAVTDGLTKIQGIVKTVPELQNLSQALDDLKSQSLSAMSGGGGNQAKVIAATANMVYSYFDKLGEIWPQMKQLIPEDRPLTEDELGQLQRMMQSAQGGLMARLGNWWKGVRTKKELAPSQIAAEIIDVVRTGQENPNQALKASESLSNLFQRLNALKLPPSMSPQGEPVVPNSQAPASAAGAGASSSSAPTSGGAPSVGGAASRASQATGQRTLAGVGPAQQNVAPADDPDKLAAQMAPVMGLQANDRNVAAQVKKLINAGWKIIPPASSRP